MTWLTIAFGYCVVCWFIGFAITRTQWWAEATCGPISRVRLALLEAWVVLFAPLAVPVGLVILGKWLIDAFREQRLLERAARTFRAYEFVNVNTLNLEEPIQEQFELHTPPLLQLGYDLIGDYRLKPEPIEVHDRFLLSPDGETLAAICALLDSGGVTLISVLADGTCVDTSSSENPRPERVTEPADQLFVTYLPNMSIRDLQAHHVNILQEFCARNGTSVMHFRRDQFREVVTYDQRIICRWRFRHCELDSAPPAPDFASLRAGSGSCQGAIQSQQHGLDRASVGLRAVSGVQQA